MPAIKSKRRSSKPVVATTGTRKDKQTMVHRRNGIGVEITVDELPCDSPSSCSTSGRNGRLVDTDHDSPLSLEPPTIVSISAGLSGAMTYPLDAPARAAFRTQDGKKLTEHQWAVYDFTRRIPCGRVTTYSALCKAIGRGSPRSVGSALRHNQFAPFVPCHRVIASNLYIGGFFGEWGTLSSGKNGDGSGGKCQNKMEMLAMEGVGFTVDGYLADKSLIWRG